MKVARLSWPLFVPYVSGHYFRSINSPFVASPPHPNVPSLSYTEDSGTGMLVLWEVVVVGVEMIDIVASI